MSSPASHPPNERSTDWKGENERGTAFAIRVTVWLAHVLGSRFGRSIGHGIAAIVAFYFVLFGKSIRARSRVYLDRVLPKPARFRDIFRHVWTFARCVFDAFLLAAGRTRAFETTGNGSEHLAQLADEKRGALLIGAHLGSFYAMRARSQSRNLHVYALVFTHNAQRINEALKKLDPEGHTTLIELEKDNMTQVMLRVRDLIEGGALVAILADRVAVDEKSVEAEFLGAPAAFPAGPFLLAATLRCPVFLTFGFFSERGVYDCVCEPIADPLILPRGKRDEALQLVVRNYAARLSHYARLYPYNWFNFFDFWQKKLSPENAGNPPAKTQHESPHHEAI